MYFESPSVKTKFIVQPCGDTMHVPAATAVNDAPSAPAYGAAVPRQLGSSAASSLCLPSSTSTPCVPAASIRASSSGVSQAGLGSDRTTASPSLDSWVAA